MKETITPLTQDQQRLVARHMDFAAKIARSLTGRGMDYEDLVGEACYGLCLAAQNYNPDLGIAFSTVAFAYCRNAMFQALRNYGSIVRMPGGKTYECQVRSLGFDSEGNINFDIASQDEDRNEADRRQLPLEQTLKQLTPRERDVISRLYGLSTTPMDAGEIARASGITTDTVNRVHSRALRKLEGALALHATTSN